MANQVSSFKRFFSDDLIDNLKTEQTLYPLLLQDIQKGIVFPCIREGRIDFYHKGGKLFQYDRNGFKTHIKYASVIEKNKRDYLTENELGSCQLVSDFVKGYGRIKENCKNYSGVEGVGVSDIYSKQSYIFKKSGVVVLDIEVALRYDVPDKNYDRIDILLYNLDEKKLKFLEAKHYSNPELWTTTQASAANQIKRYEDQILSRRMEIISGYNQYIVIVQKLFGASLPIVEEVDCKVPLLIFGYDSDQRSGRLKKLTVDNPKFDDINLYPVGNAGNIKLDNLWVKTKP